MALPRQELSLLRLRLGKVFAASSLHRAEGLRALDQGLREPLEGGWSDSPGAWWRKGEARRVTPEALNLGPKRLGAREFMDSLNQA